MPRNSSLSRLDSAILGASSSSSTQELLKSSESQNYMYFDSTSSSMRGAINEAYEIQRKKELEEGFSTTSSSVENFLGSAVEVNSGRSQYDDENDLGIKEINKVIKVHKKVRFAVEEMVVEISAAENVTLDDHGRADDDCQALSDFALDDHGTANDDCQALGSFDEELLKLQIALDDHDIVNGESQALAAKSGETSEAPSASRILTEVGTSGGLSQDHVAEVTPTVALSAKLDTTEVGIPGGISQALITALDDHDEVNGDCQALKRSDEKREALDDHGQANGDCQALQKIALDDHGQANGDCQALISDSGVEAGKRIWESWVNNATRKRSSSKRKIENEGNPEYGPQLPYNVDEDLLCRGIEDCKLPIVRQPATVDEITNKFGRASLSDVSFNLKYKRPKTGGLYVPIKGNPFASLQTFLTGMSTNGGNACERSMMDEVGPTQQSTAKPSQSLKFGPSLPTEDGDGHLGPDFSDKADGSED